MMLNKRMISYGHFSVHVCMYDFMLNMLLVIAVEHIDTDNVLKLLTLVR